VEVASWISDLNVKSDNLDTRAKAFTFRYRRERKRPTSKKLMKV
jgi:hypothetical protein